MARETLSGETRKERKKDKLQRRLNKEYRALAEVLVANFSKGEYDSVYQPTEPVEVNGMKISAWPEVSVSGGNILFAQSPIAIRDASGEKKRIIVKLNEDKDGNVTMQDAVARPIVRRRKTHPSGTVSKVSFKEAARETIILTRGIRRELTRQPEPQLATVR